MEITDNLKILRQEKGAWKQINKTHMYNETMLWTASVLRFMRAGEPLVSTKDSFGPSKHLKLEDIATDGHIPSSKFI